MAQPSTKEEIVSSESEELILVDSNDREIGFLDKTACHDADGRLHRAFSLFILNGNGDVLMQQRHASKRLWGGSHPRRGETMDEAVHRRLEQELGLRAELRFMFKFEYTAKFETLGTEHELCWVYVGRTDASPIINTTEIADWRWLAPAELDRELADHPDRYTPWLKIEWRRLRDEFPAALAG